MSHHHQHTTLTEGLVLWQLGKIARALEEKKPPKQPTPAELGLYNYNFTPEQRAIFEGSLNGTLNDGPPKVTWREVLKSFARLAVALAIFNGLFLAGLLIFHQ